MNFVPAPGDSVGPEDLPGDPQPQAPSPKPPRVAIVLWLVVISLAVFALPLYLISVSIRDNNARAQAELRSAQTALANLGIPAPEVQQLANALAQAQEATGALKTAYLAMTAAHTDWSAVMSVIGGHDRSALVLDSLMQADRRITLKGQAADDTAVTDYARMLEVSGLFSRVMVQSIKVADVPFATPTATETLSPEATIIAGPTATATAATTPSASMIPTLTVTPTSDGRDLYEPDDLQPRDIFPGETQTHTFYPLLDADTVRFLAKAGRYYRVSTAGQALGVDTVLTVNLGSFTYTNDDRQPGDSSSLLVLQGLASYDSEAVVRVSNRGQYGPDKTYQLTVEEIVPTPTPVTPVVPTATPAPTVELRDAFEPDDAAPRPIALGEVQTHSFYPDRDVDKVQFLAKAERYYQVSTSALAAAVDTFLVVVASGNTYTNDDKPAAPPNDQSSEVLFQAPAGRDLQVMVTVMNRGQDGPERTYQLVVGEVPPPPTPTPTNTATPKVTRTRTPTPSPTADLRDKYEPDDLMPTPISVGETQGRNFYPTGDVDKATFLAKAGRSYRILTSGLALGVDTLLSVSMGATFCTNDDRQPGDLSSELVCAAPEGADGQAVITVINRGQFGSDKAYYLTLSEVTSTPEPATSSSLQGASWQPERRAPGPDREPALPGSSPSERRIRRLGPGLAAPERQRSPRAVDFVIILDLKGPS